MHDARRREQRDGREGEGAEALGPGNAAEEQPPQEDRQRAAEDAAEDAVERGLGDDGGEGDPGQPLQRHGEHAGPQPQRLPPGGFVGECGRHARHYPPGEPPVSCFLDGLLFSMACRLGAGSSSPLWTYCLGSRSPDPPWSLS